MIAKLGAWWRGLGPAWAQPAHRALTVLLVVQIALALGVLWPHPAAMSEGAPALPDVKAEDVAAILLTDNEGKTVALERGDGWTIVGTEGYPAKEAVVTEILTKVLGLNTARLVTRTEASQARLEVAADAFQRKVTLRTNGGQEYTVYLGSSPSYGATHFRVEGQTAAYLTDALTAWSVNTSAANWVDTAYVSVAREKVTAITVTNAQGAFTLRPEGETDWALDNPPAGTPDTSLLSSLASCATALYLTEPLGKTAKPEYGLDAPLATIQIESADGPTTVTVGAYDAEAKSYVVKSSANEHYARVSGYSLDDLVNKGPADMLAPTPTPEAALTPMPIP